MYERMINETGKMDGAKGEKATFFRVTQRTSSSAVV